jgi:hypothetical protein
VFHIIEDVTVAAFPAVIPQMSVLTLFERTVDEPAQPNDVSLRITLNEQELYQGPIEVRFGGHVKMRWITDIRGLVLPGPGLLSFLIFFGQNQLAEWAIPVQNIGQVMVQPELPLENPPAPNPVAANPANER